MKKQSIIILSVVTTMLSCAVNKKSEYELPAEMLPHVQAEYSQQCEKGAALYRMSCGNCHNLKIKGKTVIPDFNEEDLKGYALRISNARHEQNMPDSLVTEEDLGIIMTFLRYKKKSGVLLKKGKNLTGEKES
jgi:mono/diheme cytochrome c family protein